MEKTTGPSSVPWINAKVEGKAKPTTKGRIELGAERKIKSVAQGGGGVSQGTLGKVRGVTDRMPAAGAGAPSASGGGGLRAPVTLRSRPAAAREFDLREPFEYSKASEKARGDFREKASDYVLQPIWTSDLKEIPRSNFDFLIEACDAHLKTKTLTGKKYDTVIKNKLLIFDLKDVEDKKLRQKAKEYITKKQLTREDIKRLDTDDLKALRQINDTKDFWLDDYPIDQRDLARKNFDENIEEIIRELDRRK